MLENIQIKVLQLVEQAGAFLLSESQKFQNSQIEYKGLNNLVSYVDQQTESMLVKGLQSILPEAGFITEEGMIANERKTFTWIIDPLDGTTNFLHRVPLYSISIGLMQDNDMVLGVVYDPQRKEFFHAIRGKGAFCNKEAVKVSGVSELSASLIATGFPYYEFEQMDAYLNVVKDLMKTTHGLRRCGSAAIDMAWVACGRFDAYFEYNIQSYDIAAGSLLVQEAGGIVTDFKGGSDFVFARQIVAGTKIQPLICSLIQKYW